MGHKNPNYYSLDIGGADVHYIDITAAAGDKSLSTITLPSYNGKMVKAVLHMRTSYFTNSFAGVNNTDGAQYIQVSNGGAYTNAIQIPDVSFWLSAAVTRSASFYFKGNIDISSLCSSGGTLTIKWASALSLQNTISIYGPQLYLQCVFSE